MRRISLKKAREAFEYNPKTGELIWKLRRNKAGRVNGREFGLVAGHIFGNGYRYVGIDGGTYLAHRLIWFIVTGKWPKSLIDHINGVKSDNRWRNLRPAN